MKRKGWRLLDVMLDIDDKSIEAILACQTFLGFLDFSPSISLEGPFVN